ncbi:AI-2E family transporter [Paraburkholderia sp. BL10I2N1]|uniref:AI-2E family transporter n=1 Tax=Paraburkholderia sp. BL10I2N1 TaxID=1938796 RepID=UPI001FB76160|nr:AI-2E family transporter [Paraburkholderia sp. BL10I2N1]
MICALYFGRAVLIPFTLSVLLSFLVAPFVTLLRRLKFGQLPSTIVAVLAAVMAILAIGALMAAQVGQLADALPQYQAAIERKIETVQQNTIAHADAFLAKASDMLQRASPGHETAAARTGSQPAATARAPMPVEVHEPLPSSIELAQRFVSPIVSPLETTLIVLVVTIAILLQRENVRDRLIHLFGSRDLHRATTAIDEAASRLSRYFAGQLCINVGAGIVVTIGLAIIGMPGALLFGVLTALLRFVPYIGTWIAALTAVVLAAAVSPGWTMVVWTIVLFGVIDVVAGQVAEPLLYGHNTGLSPLAVIVAAIFWTWVWGPLGLVLSTPLTLCLVILGRYVEGLAFLDVLFSDRPALSPAQTFYQRMLAGDPNEALVQAEAILKELSLKAYYDEVAREGLRLARNDVLRGVVSIEQLARMHDAFFDVVEGLENIADVEDGASKPASSGTADLVRKIPEEGDVPSMRFHASTHRDVPLVLCISGRGDFDDVAAAIALQLLGKRGLDAGLAAYEDFSRGRVSQADMTRISIICVVSLDATECPNYLRNLLRRVHERAPDTTLVLDPGTDADTRDEPRSPSRTLRASSFTALADVCATAARDGAPPPRTRVIPYRDQQMPGGRDSSAAGNRVLSRRRELGEDSVEHEKVGPA